MNRCIAETDPLGRTTRAGYDAAGRQVWQESPDGRRTTWTYDAAGRPATMAVDGRTVTALTRDLRRRTVRTVDTTGEDGASSSTSSSGTGAASSSAAPATAAPSRGPTTPTAAAPR